MRGWQNWEAEKESGFAPLPLRTHPWHLPSFLLIDFIPLCPSKAGRANQELKVARAGAGHHHSTGKVREDGEGACALPSYSAFPEVKDISCKLQKCDRSVKTPRGQLHRLRDRLPSFYVSRKPFASLKSAADQLQKHLQRFTPAGSHTPCNVTAVPLIKSRRRCPILTWDLVWLTECSRS